MSSSAASHAATKLARLNERFATFYSDLEQEKASRRAIETDRLHAFDERLDALERAFKQSESRAANDRATSHARFERAIKDLDVKLSARLDAIERAVETSTGACATTMDALNAALDAEREERVADMETLGTTVLRKVEEISEALDDERLGRLEREGETLARFGSELSEVQNLIDAERATRESAVSKLASVVEEMRHAAVTGEGNFQTVVLEELSNLKVALAKERKSREEEDELIVQAVSEYSKAIQSGLRLANA